MLGLLGLLVCLVPFLLITTHKQFHVLLSNTLKNAYSESEVITQIYYEANSFTGKYS